MRVEKSVNSELSVEVLISYQGLILSTAKKYLGKQYACWAQDVTQDVLLKAWKNGDKFIDVSVAGLYAKTSLSLVT